MQKSAMCTKLNKQFASGLPWVRCFLFLWNELFPLRGKVFFARKPESRTRQTQIRRELRCCL